MNALTSTRWLGMALLWCMSVAAEAQVVNIERQRIASDSAGWFGQASLDFMATRNTISFLSLSTGTLLQYKTPSTKDLWLLITNLGFTSGDGNNFVNTGFGHLRYNRKLGEAVRWEVFTQVQYNSLIRINRRVLTGTGPRFKLTPYENAKFYFGLAIMHEYEESIAPVILLRDLRMSSYFSFTLLPEETVSLTSTIYMQPLIRDARDYRIASETSLVLAITKKLSLNATFLYHYDAAPPEGAPKNIYSFSNSLEIGF